MNKLSQKSYELMPKFSLLYKAISLNFISHNLNEPITKLIIDFSDILKLKLDSNEITKILYFNIEKVNDILYDSDKVIKFPLLKDGKYEMSYYFYLSLLINYNINITNFDYSIDIIQNLLNQKNSDNLRKIIKTKIIMDLINNYRANYYCRYELNILEGEYKKIIVEDPKKYLEINIKEINNYKIDEIYIKIITSLIKNKKFDNYNDIYNIVKQLDLESINLVKTMIDELINFLDGKEDYVKYYIIEKIEDIFETKKINFYYILLKYILKNSFYIYQIPFLLETKKLIIKIIKSKINYLLTKKLENSINERLEYILDIITDSKFYFLKYIIFKKIKVIFENIKFDKSYQIQNEDKKIIKDYFSEKNNQLFETFIYNIKNGKIDSSFDYLKSFIDLIEQTNSSQIEDKKEYNNNEENKNDSIATIINIKNINEGSQSSWYQGINKKLDSKSISLIQSQNSNNKEFSLKVIKFAKIINKNSNKSAIKTIDSIKELSNDYFVTYGIYDNMNIYNSNYILNFENNVSRNSIYSICENSKKSEVNNLELYIFCGDKFYLYKLELDINDLKIKQNQEFPNDYSIFCFEVKNKNGKTSNIISGTKGVKYEEDIISQVLISNNDILYNNPICGGIIIENKYFVLISNEIISDKNILILYNLENSETIKKPYKIEGEYNFNLSQNNLSYVKMALDESKEEIILLCACKKYFKRKENGILILNININKLKIEYTKFIKTGSFEVYCFCPISLYEKRNNSFFSLEKSETKNAKYILIGGFEQCKGNIKLYKLFYNNGVIDLEYIDNDIIDFDKNSNFRGFKKPINCIIQNKKNGDILSSSWDGNFYLFNPPNIKYFSKYEKIYENNLLFKNYK